MSDKYERQMKKGVMDMLVLKLLEKEAKYGYQIISEMRDRGGDVFDLKEGTLYPVLYRLEKDQLVESWWSEPQGKQVARKYYRITETGRVVLAEITEIFEQILKGIHQIMEG